MRRQVAILSMSLFVAASASAGPAAAAGIDAAPDAGPVAVTDAGDGDAAVDGGAVPEGIQPTTTPDNLGCSATSRPAFGVGAATGILPALALGILLRRSRRRHATRSSS